MTSVFDPPLWQQALTAVPLSPVILGTVAGLLFTLIRRARTQS